MRRARRKAGNKDKVFGCDLLEHLSASSQEVPQVLRSCSEFIEEHGVVDGIYRLSGVSSNIQKLRNEFDNEGIPDLNKDVYQQDIHCVSSLCKAYFRELPNPLLTYQLYDKFAEAVAIQLEEDRLVKIRDVLKELPPLHYRTLEVLMHHLVKMASYSSQTNMHSRNLAIVWAPNLLRSKDIEASGFNGTAAFMEVRVQSIVVEFILTHVPQLFPEPGVSTERRKSLPSPSVLSNQEETLFRTVPFHFPTNIGNISPGDGPLAIRSYHAIIEGTDKRKGSLKGRKWKSIFNLGGRIPDPRRRHKNSTKEKEKPTLRPAKSMDSLSCDTVPYPHEVSRQRPPSSHISPLAMVSSAPQASTEGGVSGSSVGSSVYAVTYRRGAGASVSVVSGGGGVQGTYSLLDSGGTGGNGTDAVPTQNRSPGLGSKAGRRVGMHITGPLSVTVPLHITSGLALGVLGGGGDRVLPRTRQWSGGAEEEGRDVGGSKVSGADTMGGDVEPKEEMVETIEVERVSENKDGEEEETGEKEVSLEIESEVVESKGTEETLKEEEVAGLSPSVQEMTEENHVEVEHQSEENSEKEEVLDNDSDGEYMDMRVAQGSNMGASDSSSTTPNIPGLPDGFSNHTSTDIDEDNQELSEYVQDNFDFLDHMDSSFSNQMLEFSVEAPYPDEEEYEDREQLLPQDPQYRAEPSVQLTGHSLTASTAETSTPKKTQTHSYSPLTVDRYDLPNKSLSLPYKTSPFFLTQFSSDEEDADADEDYSNDEENDMFYKSLPSGFFQHLSRPDIEDASNLSPVMSAQSPNHITELSPADQSEHSDVREPQLLEKESSASSGDLVRLEMDAKESVEKKDLRDTPIKTLEQSNESEGACQSAMLLEVDKSLGNPGDLTSECSTVDCVNSLLTGTADQNAEVTDSIVDVGDVMELYESHHFEVGESVSPHRDEGDATTAEASEIAGIHAGYTVPYDVESVNIFFESPDDQLDATSQVESKGELDRRKKRDDEINEISGEEKEKDEVSVEEKEKDEVSGEEKEKDEVSGEEKEKDEVSVEMRRESGREDVTEVLAEMGESNQQEQNDGECQRQPGEELGEEETEWKDGFCDKAISEADQMKMTEDENCKEDGEKNDSNENDWSAEAVVMETMQGVLKVEEEMEGRVAQNEGGVEDESSPVGETPEHRGTGETLPVWVELQNEISQENTFSENKVDFIKRKEVEDVNIERENQTPGCQVNYTQNEIFSLPEQERDPNDSKEQYEELRDKEKEEPANEIPQTPSLLEENVEDFKVIKPDNDTLSEVKRAEKANVQKMETGQGRVLVISKQSPAKVYQVRSVPVVPPKPQHCKLTALSLRQLQQERERRESHMDREDDNLVTATGATNNEKETETDKKLDVDKVIESEQGGQEEREDEKKERDVSKISEVEKRLRDGDDRGMKEMPKNISISMCFDEAVAMVTMKRGREKENTERDKDKERRDMKQSSLEK